MENAAVLGEVGRGRLRSMSKTLFGNADRVEVAEAVARSKSGVVNGQELHELLGISPPRVRAQLLALCSADLLRQLPRVGQRLNYEVVNRHDPFWGLVSEVATAWRSEHDSE